MPPTIGAMSNATMRSLRQTRQRPRRCSGIWSRREEAAAGHPPGGGTLVAGGDGGGDGGARRCGCFRSAVVDDGGVQRSFLTASGVTPAPRRHR